jgi:hypothetical protein
LSNALEIDDGYCIKFATKHVAPELIELIKKAQEDENWPSLDYDNLTKEAVDYYLVWWFLSTNVDFEKRSMVINLGYGRSAHTWRDLRQTIWLLNDYWRSDKTFHHVCRIADEGDEYQTLERYIIHLGIPYRYVEEEDK